MRPHRRSPAQKLIARRLGAIAAAERSGAVPVRSGAETTATAAYRAVLAELGECQRELKQIQAREKKIERKRALIGRFDDWVNGVLDAHRAGAPAVQDDVVLTMMVWALDIERHDQALDLVGYVLDNDLAMPERYTRTAPTVIAEIAADTALGHLGRGEPCDLAFLQLIEERTRDLDMIDEVRAKLHKAIGLALIEVTPPADGEDGTVRGAGRRPALAAAIPHLKRALDLNAKSGVKKQIEKAERELVKSTEGAPS